MESTSLAKLQHSRSSLERINIPIARPTLPSLEEICDLVRKGWDDGSVTVGAVVEEFEAAIKTLTGASHAIAVSSGTAGLMLVPRALDLPQGGEVIVPSFTFAATAQAVVWNGLTPVFCDCLPGTKTLDPDDVLRNLTPRTVAICPTYIYGLPPDIEPILKIGRKAKVPVYFDSAQGLGATYRGKPAGRFGACEVFSLSPTKVITAVEGGVITTDDPEVAQRLRSLREYGKDFEGGEEMILLGLSARLSELHAAIGLLSLRNAEELARMRMRRLSEYRNRLGSLRGCTVQEYPSDRTTNGSYFVLFVSDEARLTRNELYVALWNEGIQTRRYFYPSLEQHRAFERCTFRISADLRDSIMAAATGLALPLYSHISDAEIDRVCGVVEDLLR